MARLPSYLSGRDSRLPVLRRVPGSERRIALSFDDGPNEDSTPRLLDLLDLHNARASFFLSGVRAARWPAIVGEIVRRGHDVYAHGWDHVRHDELTAQQIAQSLERTEALLRAWRPTPAPYLVRLPHGAGHRRRAVHQAIRTWNPQSQIADWSASSRDWTIGDRCASLQDVEIQCQSTLDALFATQPVQGSILLLHDQPIGRPSPYAAEITLRFAALLLAQLSLASLEAVAIPPQRPRANVDASLADA